MPKTKANRLHGAQSAYLASAAHQPVDWHPWGHEALDRARRENKPILLDIGAVWCHWCHVMDRESYENEDIAALINMSFVAIKVDRDESPDIDARYQAAISALTRQGGWPLTAFLTPGGKPFFGGTYFPPEDRWGRPGFKRILAGVAESFEKRRDDVEDTAERLSRSLREAEKFGGSGESFDPQAAVSAISGNAFQLFDPRHGGFGQSPKFPHPPALDLLMETYQSNKDENTLNVVRTTLDGMARGGVYDHLAGGFHRYSVDERWHVPHFEKMSYDNSELLRNYLHGYQLTGENSYRRVAEGIIEWVDRDLSDPERGGFFASQDADVNLEDDGDHFTWTVDEVRAGLSAEEAELVIEHFDVRAAGDMHHNPAKNVLRLHRTAEELAGERSQKIEQVLETLRCAHEKMFAARLKRPIPYIDRTVYVSWNAMFCSAYFDAAQVLDRTDCREQALRTLDRLWESAWSDAWGFTHRCPEQGRVDRDRWSGGVLEDQVFMVHALLDAYEATVRKVYFDRAVLAMALCLQHFWDEEGAGFFDRPTDAPPIAEELDLPRKPFQDSPTPGANSVAALALDRLYGYMLDEHYRLKAEQTLGTFVVAAGAYGLHAASYGLAAVLHSRHPLKVVVVGPPEDEGTRGLVRAAHSVFRFGKAVLVFPPEKANEDNLPPGLALTVPHLKDTEPVALVCGNTTCQPPARTPEELLAALSTISAAAGSGDKP